MGKRFEDWVGDVLVSLMWGAVVVFASIGVLWWGWLVMMEVMA